MTKARTQGFDIGAYRGVVIGCGGLGCNVSVHLAGAGIGKLTVVDFDTVSPGNLNRQFLYSPEDIGSAKASLCAQRLKKYAPDTDLIAVDQKLEDESDLDFMSDCDIIFSAVDNVETRMILQKFCIKHRIPLVNGGINGFFGSVYLFVPGNTPCLDCAGVLKKESGVIRSVSTTAGIIGALQAQFGIQYLINSHTDAAGVLHLYDNGEITKLKIKPRQDCGICGRNKNV